MKGPSVVESEKNFGLKTATTTAAEAKTTTTLFTYRPKPKHKVWVLQMRMRCNVVAVLNYTILLLSSFIFLVNIHKHHGQAKFNCLKRNALVSAFSKLQI